VLDQIKARKIFIPCGFSGLYEPAYEQYFSQLPHVLAKFDHLIFYAESYRDIDFARAHGLTRFTVLPNGASEVEFNVPADPGFRARFGISDADFVFLTVGAPIATKGHRETAEAFALLDTAGRPATLILNANWPLSRTNTWCLTGRRSRPLELIENLRWLFWDVVEPRISLARYAFQLLREKRWQAFVERSLRRLRLKTPSTVNGGGDQAGRPPTIDDLIKVAELQGGKRVLRTNFSRSDLVQAYMAADLFVFASTVEYSPLVLFEAAAAGTPFLSVPVGNAEEIARWTGGGMICPAAKDERGYVRVDPSRLAREIERCMDSPDMLARLGAAGKETWRRMFTWRAIAPQYEAILSGRATGVMPQEFPSGEIPDAAGHESVQRIVCS
jgi:glycosyltransferase involved in cell wall biosynthesis